HLRAARGRGGGMTGAILDRSTPPPPGDLRAFRFPPVERHTLSNGLPVLFARTEGLPVCTFSLLIPAGALQEDASKAGVATLTGSLLESGTVKLGPAALSEALEGLGVRVQVGTSWEVAHVEFTALTDRVAAAAELVA